MPYHGTCATNNEKPVEERHRPSVIIARGSHAPRVAFLMWGERERTTGITQRELDNTTRKRNAGQYITTFHLTASHLRAKTLVCCKRQRGWVQQWKYANKMHELYDRHHKVSSTLNFY